MRRSVRKFLTPLIVWTLVVANANAQAVPLGPEGGLVVMLTVHPGLALAATDNLQSGDELDRQRFVVWASTDEGLTWRRATTAERRRLRFPAPTDRVRDPSRLRTIYRLDQGPFERPSFHVSTDNGLTYKVRNSVALRALGRGKLVALGTRRTTLLFGVAERSEFDTRVGEPDGVRRSTDGGVSWKAARGIRGKVLHFWPHPQRARTLFAATVLAEDRHALYRSDDAGRRWRRIGKGIRLRGIGTTPNDLLTLGSSLLVATDRGLYRSTDRGRTFTRVVASGVNDLQHQPGSEPSLLAGGDAGVYRSTDSGKTWKRQTRGMYGTTALAIAAAGNPVRIYVAGFFGDSLLVASDDGGVSWRHAPLTMNSVWPFGDIAVNANTPDNAFVAGGARTRDRGQTWTPVRGPATATVIADQVNGTMYSQGFDDRIYRSIDTGATWSAVGRLRGLIDEAVAADGHLYAIVEPSSVLWRSPDDGRTWRSVKHPAGDLISVVVAPSEPATVYGVLLRPGATFLIRSSDGGTSWSSRPLPAALGSPSAILVDRRNPLRLYLANEFTVGMWTSADGGRTWSRIADRVRDVEKIVQPAGSPDTLYVATWRTGVWEVPLRP